MDNVPNHPPRTQPRTTQVLDDMLADPRSGACRCSTARDGSLSTPDLLAKDNLCLLLYVLDRSRNTIPSAAEQPQHQQVVALR